MAVVSKIIKKGIIIADPDYANNETLSAVVESGAIGITAANAALTITAASGVVFSADVGITGTTTFTGDVLPAVANSYDLGSSAANFYEVHASAYRAASAITIYPQSAATGLSNQILGGQGSAGNGGAMTVRGGQGTSTGGAANLYGGAGDTAGGDVNITSGQGNSGSGVSGDVNISTDAASDSGDIVLTPGTASGTRGRVKLAGDTVNIAAQASSDPATTNSGDIYYNTTSNQIKYYNGSSWTALDTSATDAYAPVGSIVAWIGGYFSDGSNAGFTSVLGNTVSDVNSALTANWRVCDGSVHSDSGSSIFNGANRYLPNLTDDRFLMGDTTVSGQGGANTMAHTHSVTSNVTVANHTLIEANLPSHTHGTGTYATASNGAHTHTTSGTAASNGAHTHTLSMQFGAGTPSSSGVRPAGTTSGAGGAVSIGDAGTYAESGGAHTHSVTGTAASNGAHTHTISGSSGSTGSGTAVTHSVTNNAVTSDAASNDENRPQYLTCFYIMRIK